MEAGRPTNVDTFHIHTESSCDDIHYGTLVVNLRNDADDPDSDPIAYRFKGFVVKSAPVVNRYTQQFILERGPHTKTETARFRVTTPVRINYTGINFPNGGLMEVRQHGDVHTKVMRNFINFRNMLSTPVAELKSQYRRILMAVPLYDVSYPATPPCREKIFTHLKYNEVEISFYQSPYLGGVFDPKTVLPDLGSNPLGEMLTS